MRRSSTFAVALAAGLVGAVPAAPGRAQESVVRVEERQFKAGAGRITFSEVPLGTVDPVYTPALYGGTPDSPTVRFGGHFRGRRLGVPAECPRGAAITGCLAGQPAAPLTLDPAAPSTRVMPDKVPQPPQLGGSPRWNGPVAIWFDRDVAAVGLQGGIFNAVGGTAITVYDRQGRTLGRTANRGLGVEFMGLATADRTARIAGLEFHLVGAEPAGFGVDNIRFGAPQQIDLPGLLPKPPEPRPEPQRRPVMLP